MPSRPPGRPLEPGAPRGPVSILASSTRTGLGLQQRPTQLGVSGLVGDKYAGFERQLIRDKGHLMPSGTVGDQPALSLLLSPLLMSLSVSVSLCLSPVSVSLFLSPFPVFVAESL